MIPVHSSFNWWLPRAVDLLSLLRWKSDPEGIGDTLSRLERVDGAETVKFLQDVLDALFSMFSTEEGNSTQHSGHVFHSLVGNSTQHSGHVFHSFLSNITQHSGQRLPLIDG